MNTEETKNTLDWNKLAKVTGGFIPPLPPSANHDHGQLTEKDKRIINCD